MDKFLCAFKLSKGAIITGWLKVATSMVVVILSIAALTFSTDLLDFFKKLFREDDKEFYSTRECENLPSFLSFNAEIWKFACRTLHLHDSIHSSVSRIWRVVIRFDHWEHQCELIECLA
jgi:hypothetical protein